MNDRVATAILVLGSAAIIAAVEATRSRPMPPPDWWRWVDGDSGDHGPLGGPQIVVVEEERDRVTFVAAQV